MQLPLLALWAAAVDAERLLVRLPCVGMILDTILGPAEDFSYVSRTTPVERD